MLSRFCLSMFLSFSLLTACTTAQLHTAQRHEGFLQLAVALGVDQFLKAHPPLASTVYQVAHGAQATLHDTIDLTQLRPSIHAAFSQSPVSSDHKVILDTLADAIMTEVQQYLTVAELKPSEVQVLVAKVMGWIADAANLRLGGKAAA